MTIISINTIACFFLFLGATWGGLERRHETGVIDKILYSSIALAALAVVLTPTRYQGVPPTSEVTLNVALALLGIRHGWRSFGERMIVVWNQWRKKK